MLIYHAPRLLLPETLSLDKPDNQNSELSYLACTRRPINQTYFLCNFKRFVATYAIVSFWRMEAQFPSFPM